MSELKERVDASERDGFLPPDRWSMQTPLSLMVLILLGCTGCEPTPHQQDLSSISSSNLVSTSEPSPQNPHVFHWPVVGKTWQATKPTDYAFLRNLKSGVLGEAERRREAEDLSRLNESLQGEAPAPWTTAGVGFKDEARVDAALAVGEMRGEPREWFEIQLPKSLHGSTVHFNVDGRHLAACNESGVWVSRLPWSQWWRLIGIPEFAIDEPGTPNDFEKLDLGTDASRQGRKPLIEFYVTKDKRSKDNPDEAFPSGARCVIAWGNEAWALDCAEQKVLGKHKFKNPIRHLSVSLSTGQSIVVDELGALFVLDSELREVERADQVDLSLPMPTIAPDGARVAMYRTASLGRVIKLEEGAPVDSFDVPIQMQSKPLSIVCSGAYDLWLEKNAIHRRPNYSPSATEGRTTAKITSFWDLEKAFPTYDGQGSNAQICVSESMLPDGSQQRQMWDAALGRRSAFAPCSLQPLGDGELVVCPTAHVVAMNRGDRVTLYRRNAFTPSGPDLVYQLGQNWSWQSRFKDVEKLYRLIRELPEKRFQVDREYLTYMLIHGIVDQWIWTEQLTSDKYSDHPGHPLAKPRLPEFVRWGDQESALALSVRFLRHSKNAWAARGNGSSASVSQDAGKVFAKENRMAMEQWNQLRSQSDVPALSLGLSIQLARDTGLTYGDVKPALTRALNTFPTDMNVHGPMMFWRLERWGGSKGSGAAYAAAVAKAIGPPEGDLLYARCVSKVQFNYQFGYFTYARVDGTRVLNGIRHGIQTDALGHSEVCSMMRMLVLSYTKTGGLASTSGYGKSAKKLCQELADYVRSRFPFLPRKIGGNSKYKLIHEFLPD